MQELSLHMLDVAQNSLAAGATLVELEVCYTLGEETVLTIAIADNGRGMSQEVSRQVADPFYTTRTTRPVGLGIPLFKMAAELTGGSLALSSQEGVGTRVQAVFYTDHIDAMPMGDLSGTYLALLQTGSPAEVVLRYRLEQPGREPKPEPVQRQFTADTREFRAVLGEVPLTAPEVLQFIGEYLSEQLAAVWQGIPNPRR